MYNRYLITL